MTWYKKGAQYERITQHWLEREGYYVTRSAGSHGLFDLIAIASENCKIYTSKILAIQIKSVSNEDFEDTFCLKFLKSKAFEKFRDYKFHRSVPVTKLVFIYNRDRKYFPAIWEYTDTWGNLQGCNDESTDYK